MKTDKTPWRSPESRNPSPEYVEELRQEFPNLVASAEAANESGSVDRRSFLTLMGASLGAVGASGCIARKPVEKILPYGSRPEDRVPGKPEFYATSAFVGGGVIGLLVESQDGRPTKIEGNPDHPMSGGATSAWAQAIVRDLYDPDRGQSPTQKGAAATWAQFDEFAKAHFDGLRAGGGEGIALLVDATPSPTYNKVLADFVAAFPKARIYRHDLADRPNATKGLASVGLKDVRASYRFDQARIVVALDADPFGYDADATANLRAFTNGRRLTSEKDEMNRLYAVEPNFTITGGQADNRLRLKGAQVGVFLKALASKLFSLGIAAPAGSESALAALQGATGDGDFEKWVAALAKDLKENAGKSLIVVGDRQPAAVHALTAMVNHALGNTGRTIVYTPTGLVPAGTLTELAAAIRASQVKTLVVAESNPAYTAPAALDFGALVASVPTSICLGFYPDETSKAATWYVPASHALESWGDLTASDGTYSIVQPLIAPLFESRSALEFIAKLSGSTSSAYDLVRANAQASHPGADFEKNWRKWLHDGVVKKGEAPAAQGFDWSGLTAAVSSLPKGEAGGLELNLVVSPAVYDGRYANNAWLQETPDPMSKLTWDNALYVSPKTAEEIGVKMGPLSARGKDADLVEVSVGDAKLEVPAWILPGVADGSLILALGYGRSFEGRAAKDVGFNAYRLLRAEGAWIADGASVRPVGKTYRMATTQEHGDMENRPIVREATLEEFRKEPNFAKEMVEHPPLKSLWTEPNAKDGMQWGMAVDLTACNGCNACMVACVSENNVPVVGKERVAWGRELHWLRLDRYFIGDEADPQAVMQPMMCSHCELAPCEGVCPVSATVHSPEGLNDMAYNRCIGTRYCSNNCPFKVRRYNWFAFQKEPMNKDPDLPDLTKMQKNPDVTIRFRGVMEKCTYCVQRISEARAEAKRHGKTDIADGAMHTACEQACPAQAIVFGNINDPASRVSKLKAQNRDYVLLAELNIKPRTSYLAKIRNPNPDLV